MSKQRITRRHVLASAGAVGGIAALTTAAPAFAESNRTSTSASLAARLAGSWLNTVKVSGAPVSLSLLTFDTGGGIVETDANDATPPTASPGHGAWAGTGGNTFAIKVVKFLFDTSGANIGLLEFGGPNEIDNADTLQGSGTVKGTTFGGQVLFSATYTYVAKRIQVGPI